MYNLEQFRTDSGYDWAGLLRAYRVATRCKQSTLAEDLGVAQPQISRWENGYSRPSKRHQGVILEMASEIECVAPSPSWMDRITRTAAVAMCADSKGVITTMSEGMLEVAGLDSVDVIGHPLADVFEGDIPALFSSLSKAGFFEGSIPEALSADDVRFTAISGGRGFKMRANHWMRSDTRGENYWVWVGAAISDDWFKRTRDELESHWVEVDPTDP